MHVPEVLTDLIANISGICNEESLESYLLAGTPYGHVGRVEGGAGHLSDSADGLSVLPE